jgi:hypothetical protein
MAKWTRTTRLAETSKDSERSVLRSRGRELQHTRYSSVVAGGKHLKLWAWWLHRCGREHFRPENAIKGPLEVARCLIIDLPA